MAMLARKMSAVWKRLASSKGRIEAWVEVGEMSLNPQTWALAWTVYVHAWPIELGIDEMPDA